MARSPVADVEYKCLPASHPLDAEEMDVVGEEAGCSRTLGIQRLWLLLDAELSMVVRQGRCLSCREDLATSALDEWRRAIWGELKFATMRSWCLFAKSGMKRTPCESTSPTLASRLHAGLSVLQSQHSTA